MHAHAFQEAPVFADGWRDNVFFRLALVGRLHWVLNDLFLSEEHDLLNGNCLILLAFLLQIS